MSTNDPLFDTHVHVFECACGETLPSVTVPCAVKWEETGEVRPPSAGEWFRGYRGFEMRADMDFTAQSFPILRMILTLNESEEDGGGYTPPPTKEKKTQT